MPHRKRAVAPPRKSAPRTPGRPRKASPRKPTPRATKQRPPPRAADPFAKKTGARRTYYTGEFLAEAKRRIEQTRQSTTAIASDLGMDKSVLWRLVRRYRWVRPEGSLRLRGLSPVMRLAVAADELASAASSAAPPRAPPTPDPSPPLASLAVGGEYTALAAPVSLAPPAPDSATIDRLEAAVRKELATVETMRASLGAEPLRPADAERTARTLSTLTETLAKLRRLRLGSAPQTGSIDHDDMPADIDEFRRDFARRIDLFVASRAHGAGAGEAGPAGGVDPV
jgi:hypothetical protein